MIKKGRPKDMSKARNRIHSVVLTEKAEIIYRFLGTKQKGQWFSKWISKKLCDDFPIENEEQFLLKEMLRREKEMHKAQDDFYDIKKKYQEIRTNKQTKDNLEELSRESKTTTTEA